MSIWDKDKRTFTNPNDFHNKESMDSMFEGTCLTELDIYQNPQSSLKNKMSIFDEADLQKSYDRAQRKDYGNVTIEIRSRHIRRKL